MTEPPRINLVHIHVPLYGNELLEKALDNVNQDLEVRTLWRVINVNAMDRLGMSDHGPVHFQIVANIALRLTRIMVKHGVEMSITKYYGLSSRHAELVVLLASLFHDLGMSIHREGHEEFSLFLATPIIQRTLAFLPVEERTIVTSEALHAILAHRSGGHPYTLEAGIVRVADALDMSEGRSRIPYQAGKVDIYSLSAAAIDSVRITDGGKAGEKPVNITVTMNSLAGLFQVEELLKPKLMGSGIELYVKVRAVLEKERETRLIEEYEIR